MNYRKLGATGLEVSEVGFGCSRLNSVTGRAGKGEALRLVQSALESGITFFDTADSYGQGDSEKLLATALRTERHRVVIATKVGYRPSTMMGFARRLKPILRIGLRARPGVSRAAERARSSLIGHDFSPQYVREAVDGCLARLECDSIDLLQLHSPPREVIEDPTVWEVLADIKRQGKVRCIGISAASTEDAVTALAVPGLSCVQVELNLLQATPLRTVIPLAVQRNIAVIVRQPLASGRLLPLHTSGGQDAGSDNEVVAEVQAMSSAWGRALHQLAFEFVLGAGGVAVVLLGTSNLAHFREDIELIEMPRLHRDGWLRLHAAAIGETQLGLRPMPDP
jgi:aryl-alcohol dehydrogenase-like predicted oxidoreductase